MGGDADDGGRGGVPWLDYGWVVLAAAASTAESASDAPDVEAARARFHASLHAESAFATLAANALLDIDSAETLAVVAASETDQQCRVFVRAIVGTDRPARLTLGSLTHLFDSDHRGALTVAHHSPLRRTSLIEVSSVGAWGDRTVEVHPGVIWALLGDTSIDADLPVDTELVDVDDSPEQIVQPAPSDFVVVNGADRMRRRQLGMAATAGTRFLCAAAPETEVAWSALVREATISGRALVIEVGDRLDPAGRRWIDRATHLTWVLSTPSGPALDELPRRARVDLAASSDGPTDDEWTAVLGTGVERTHRLTFDQLHRVSRAAQGVQRDGPLTDEQFDAAVRRLASGRLDRLTRRIRPSRTWRDLVVGTEQLGLLRSITDRYEQSTRVYDEWGFTSTPSRGLVALFSGVSGTGKTLASEIIAGELGLDLFKLDLSSVVSKYIGETEKNLEQIFDAASAGNLVLFFDEADSLFGKRSEVKDSRDRYANVEVSYLLQRLERYDGLVIMATNFEKNIDDAFLRRIHIRIPFTLPEQAERAEIWRTNFPATAPLGDVDVDWLAERFQLSGGAIRNAAVHAAFHAAANDRAITMESVVLGVAQELRKMGRLVKAEDFGDFHEVVDNS